MARLAWLTVCIISILSSTQLIADNQQSRHFNINPGNMMNPMQNMFGSSNRNQGPYNDMPYYPPQGYQAYPPTYGYPSTAYQPPAGYSPPAPPAYYPPTPGNQQQTAPTNKHNTEPTNQNRYTAPLEMPRMAPAYPSAPQEKFQFRPLGNQPLRQTDERQYAPTPTYQDSVSTPPTGTPFAPTRNIQQTANPSYMTTPPNAATAYAPQVPVRPNSEPIMNFRPLDKPGYSD